MKFDVDFDGRSYFSLTASDAAAVGIPAAVVAAHLKQKARTAIEATANARRAAVVSASAGKLAEYRFKEEIARDVANADPDELALIDREAVAFGMDRSTFLSLISEKAKAYRQIALLIGALEAESKAAVAVLPDDPDDIERFVQDDLEAGRREAEAAFQADLAALAG
jgi:putative lipase involved disintegration of autophagic bodies